MNDRQIISGIKERDEHYIEYAINKYSRLIWKITSAILTKIGPVEDIEECVADVFIFLWENPEKFEPERGNLKSWLAIVARSKATDKYRSLSRQSTVSTDDLWLADSMNITTELMSQETKRELLAAVCELEEPEREITVRRYYYEQKPREIAIAMNMHVKQVDNHLYRAKQKLRKQIS